MLNNKFWQGFFALAPLLSLFLILIAYFWFIFLMIAGEGEHGNWGDAEVIGGVFSFLVIILLVVLISLGSLIFYIVHAAQNPNLRGNNMLLVWILLFIFANGIGQLIYWIIEILNKPKEEVVT